MPGSKILNLLLSIWLAGLMVWGLAASLTLARNSTLTRLTTASGEDRASFLPVLSADGNKVIFHSNADFLNEGIPVEQTEIWLYNTATLTMTRLTTAIPAGRGSGYPVLSADGSKIAFASDSDFLGQGIPEFQLEIWLYDTTTLTVTRLTAASDVNRDSGYPSINADGSKVVFHSNSDFLNQGVTENQSEIWLFDTMAMTVTRLTTATHWNRRSVFPGISADGSKVAFRSDADFLGQGIEFDQWEVWLYDTAAMTLTRVTTASDASRDSMEPSLNADGSKVVFDSDSDFLGQGIPDNQHEIWLYDTATMTITRLTTASEMNRSSSYATVSADGRKVVFHSDSDFLGQGIPAYHREIWLYDMAAMTVTRLTQSQSDRFSLTRSLSADGSKVVFDSDADFLNQGVPAGQREIWLYSNVNMLFLPVVFKN